MIKGLSHAHLILQSYAIDAILKSEIFRNNSSRMNASGEWMLSLNGMQYRMGNLPFGKSLMWMQRESAFLSEMHAT